MGLAASGALPSILEDELEPVRILCATLILGLLALSSLAQDAPPPSGFSVEGLLVPVAQARLASRAKGVIDMIKREGDLVKKDEVVMQLESDMESLQRDQQEHVLQLRTFERSASDELNQKSVISKTEVEEKRVNHEVAKVQLQMSEHLLRMRKVVAPFDGVVSERLRERGEAVDEFTPVLNLVKLDELYLEAFLPSAKIRQIKVGQPVQVSVVDLPGRVFQGTVAEVAPSVNAASGEFRVRVLVANVDGELVAGTPASAAFATES